MLSYAEPNKQTMNSENLMPRWVFNRLKRLAVLVSVLALSFTAAATNEKPFIIVASTTSTEDSGLFDYMLPKFERQTDIDVRVVAVGTGEAIELAKHGDADVLLVHHKPSEQAFVAQGHGVKRYPVMWNDFIIVGPGFDPADISGIKNAPKAFRKIAEAKATFASRGDDSGTHSKELEIWQSAGVNVAKASGKWYRELGQGMGPTLNTAAAMNAYTLSDRGTWIAFDNRQNLKILVQGDPELINQYGVILVNPKKHPYVKAKAGEQFIDWLVSKRGQKIIGSYQLKNQQLFHPNAGDPGA
jgi:tungstate transport system substrate-binding protein